MRLHFPSCLHGSEGVDVSDGWSSWQDSSPGAAVQDHYIDWSLNKHPSCCSAVVEHSTVNLLSDGRMGNGEGLSQTLQVVLDKTDRLRKKECLRRGRNRSWQQRKMTEQVQPGECDSRSWQRGRITSHGYFHNEFFLQLTRGLEDSPRWITLPSGDQQHRGGENKQRRRRRSRRRELEGRRCAFDRWELWFC